jgi:polyisoprenoid-binding protein YceI
MNHTTNIFLSLLFTSVGLFSCQNDAPLPQAKTTTAPAPSTAKSSAGDVIYTVTEGIIYWSGSKATGDSHSGTINVEGGELVVDNGQLQSGTVTIDMASLVVSDLNDAGEKKELESHLKDGDFFNVQKFPKASFKFSEVLPSTLPAFNAVIAGELTMKGKTKTVNVPVKLALKEDLLTAESAAFPINRTDWGVNFRSGILGTARDKMIEDVVPLSIKLKARPKSN